MKPEGESYGRVVARIAEDVYGPITDLYDLRPDTKVSFVLKDFEDYSMGPAYFFDNVIEIWAPALNTPFRGDHNWLRNVITHEFTHMIQVQKTMKASRHLPFMFLQYLDYEEVSRPDVLYGFPNVLASYRYPYSIIQHGLPKERLSFSANGWTTIGGILIGICCFVHRFSKVVSLV